MKISKKEIHWALSAFLFFSCQSTKNNFPQSIEGTGPTPPLLTKLPVVQFQGAGIKYEFESMLLYHFVVFPDAEAVHRRYHRFCKVIIHTVM